MAQAVQVTAAARSWRCPLSLAAESQLQEGLALLRTSASPQGARGWEGSGQVDRTRVSLVGVGLEAGVGGGCGLLQTLSR